METRTNLKLMAVAVMVVLIGAGSTVADVYDHFDDGVLDAAWNVTFDNSTDWTYSESGTHLTVTDVGDVGAIVYISQDFYASGNFDAECSFSWDSAGTNRAMQAFGFELLSGETRVALAHYHDPWLYHRGEKQAYIGANLYSSGLNTLPLSGSATVKIQRIAGMVTVYWNDSILLTGSNIDIVDKLRIMFVRSTYHSGVFGSFSIDYVSASSATLSLLEITGPNEVAEDFSAQYKAIAHYDNGGTADVTGLADWSVEPNIVCSIDGSGLLTAGAASLPTEAAIVLAEYSEGEVTFQAEKEIEIFALCPSGTALDFDGRDYVYCGNDESLEITAQITVEAWVYPRSNQWMGLVSKGDDVAGHDDYGLWLNNRRVEFSFNWPERWPIYPNGDRFIGNNQIPLNSWSHVAGTWDGSKLRIYINGQLDREFDWTYGINSSKASLYFGVNPGGGDEYFNGIMDEVRIWSRALDAQEIEGSMYNALEGSEPNLVGYWSFDEGSGQDTLDQTQNGNNGTLGSNPQGEDSRDPAWVDTVAPVGICGLGGFVERNLNEAFDLKAMILEDLALAMEKEQIAKNSLEAAFRDGAFEGVKKSDVAKAKQKIHSAIQKEEQAATAVEQSVDKLDEALNTLGID
ncbi:MAG: LamG domain-containing protein [Planctomycetota bacterium]|jgi:hypothetical protein